MGLPADAVTCAELGCHAISVLTGTLVQDTAAVESIEPVSPELMDDQARCLPDYSHLPMVVHLQRMPHIPGEDELDAEETQVALLELLLPQADLVVVDHTLLQQWQSHGLLPGQTLERAMDALLEYGASALLISGVPGIGMQRGYLLRDEHSQTARWASPISEPVIDTDGLLATAATVALARGSEVPQAVDQAIALVSTMSERVIQPGMGARIFNRSRS